MALYDQQIRGVKERIAENNRLLRGLLRSQQSINRRLGLPQNPRH